MLSLLSINETLQHWGEIGAALEPAVKRDPKRDLGLVKAQVATRNLVVWKSIGAIRAYVVTQITSEPEGRVFWTIYIAGEGKPSESRPLMRLLEQRALETGCKAHRFEGRKGWGKLFPDYERTQGPDGRWHYRKGIQ